MFFENNKPPEGQIRFLKRFIEDNCLCCVCYNNFEGNYKDINICESCGNGCCLCCIVEMRNNNQELECPVCKKSFTSYVTWNKLLETFIIDNSYTIIDLENGKKILKK